MCSVRIRRMRASDKEAAKRIVREAFRHGRVAASDLDDGFWWVAVDGSEIVGVAGMDEGRTRGTGYLTRAVVRPDYRGMGIQKRLIRARLSWARQIGWERVTTFTYPDNAPSVNSLIACGFRLFIPRNPWAPKQCLYWVHNLEK